MMRRNSQYYDLRWIVQTSENDPLLRTTRAAFDNAEMACAHAQLISDANPYLIVSVWRREASLLWHLVDQWLPRPLTVKDLVK